MQLKKLEIVGFKSFANKTDFLFDGGTTCIVGPNGCGKSNVVDALKWVLGEQRAKSLRGGEMLDVIFSGTETRASQGMAEVSLTIANTKNILPVEYDEVRVTRRLYLSGDSEYLLNGDPCRLRDIRDMFLDTGVGKEAYSFIEQGKIDAILQTNPTDRRVIFEEAAGISRYKMKRVSAERKLERVEQNLVRLQDIIDEVAKHSRSIKRQAAKARRWRTLSDELNILQVRLARLRYGQMSEEQALVEAALTEKVDALTQLQARRGILEATVKQHEEELLGLEREVSRQQSQLHEVNTKINSANERIGQNTERKKELASERERHQQQIVLISDRLVHLRDELATTQRELEGLETAGVEHRAFIAAKEADVVRYDQDAAQRNKALNAHKQQAMNLMKEESDVSNRLTALATEKRTLLARSERLRTRRTEIGDERETFVTDLDRLSEEKKHIDHEKSELAGRLAALENSLAGNRAQSRTLTDRIVTLRQQESALASKHELYHDQLDRLEGYNAGVRHLVQELTDAQEPAAGLYNTVASFLEVDLKYAAAIEIALGDSYQAIVSADLDAGIAAIKKLKQNNQGRAAFVPLTGLAAQTSRGPVPDRAVGWAVDLVRADRRCADVIETLLGNTLVVKHLGDALLVREAITLPVRIVTLEGDLIEPNGIVEGGAENGGGGVISQKSQMKSLEVQLEKVCTEVNGLEAERNALDAQAETLDHELGDLRRRIEGTSVTLLDKQSEITQFTERVSRLSEESRVMEMEAEEVATETSRIESEEGERVVVVESVRARAVEINRKIEEGASGVGAVETELANARQSLTELKVAAAKASEKAAGLKQSVTHLNRQLESSESGINQAQEAIEACIVKSEEAEQRCRESEAAIAGFMTEKEERQQELISQEHNRSVLKQKVDVASGEASGVAGQISSVDEAVTNFRLKVNEFRVKKEDLAERVKEEHGLDVEEEPSVQEPTDESGEPTGSDTVAEADSEPASPLEPELSAQELPSRVEELKEALGRIGNVNLDAIDELEELELRETFLTAQQTDLTKARNRLVEVIQKINKTSRELFEETFNAVRENFRLTFRKLFGGGKADVFLQEGDDILEAGIEIMARPPGKELRSISLMSGGEKTLTAIALLFAIFKSKPSPFCVLDEVDAALDDNNIGRFLGMLKDYVQDSQFLIITHNKQTMAAADRLYGITMEERGVSKKIAIRFEDQATDPVEDIVTS